MYLRTSKSSCIPIVIFSLYSLIFSQSDGDNLVGRWYTEKCMAAFDFFHCGQEYQARLIALQKPNLIDSLNPADSLKNRRLNGAVTIFGLQYDTKQQRWCNGKVYNPENGKTYSCTCAISKDGTLNFRGFLGVSLLGQSQVWTRTLCTNKP